MKKSQVLLFFCTLMIPAIVFGQESQSQSNAKSEEKVVEVQGETKQETSTGSAGNAFMSEQSSEQVRSDQLVGSAVTNASDEEIGTIDDLVLNKDGKVVGIVVGVGGFLGMGEKHVALSWQAVEITRGEGETDYKVRTDVDKATLEEAEAFKTEERKQAERRQQQRQQQAEQQLQQPVQQPPVEEEQ